MSMPDAIADIIAPVRVLGVCAWTQLLLLLNLDDRVEIGRLLRLLLPADDASVKVGVRPVV